MPKASMRDVAKHANVSVATVSHVINETRFVAEDTRQRVLDSIQKLDYSPDATARSFKTGRKNLIGFIVPDIANEYFSTIIEEVESIIAKENYKLIIANTKETKSREIENVRVFTSGIVDGLIIASTMDNYEELEKYLPKGFPTVFVDRFLKDCPYDSIIISTYSSIYQGVETLIRDGHRRIGYINAKPELSTSSERFLAYKNAMNAYQLPIEEGFVRMGNCFGKNSMVHIDVLLKLGCTAIIAPNNVLADDVLYYLNEKNIEIGKAIDIIGFNDSDKFKYNLRNIHTVRQPTIALGLAAGKQILDRIAKPDMPIRQIILQSTFEPRNS